MVRRGSDLPPDRPGISAGRARPRHRRGCIGSDGTDRSINRQAQPLSPRHSLGRGRRGAVAVSDPLHCTARHVPRFHLCAYLSRQKLRVKNPCARPGQKSSPAVWCNNSGREFFATARWSTHAATIRCSQPLERKLQPSWSPLQPPATTDLLPQIRVRNPGAPHTAGGEAAEDTSWRALARARACRRMPALFASSSAMGAWSLSARYEPAGGREVGQNWVRFGLLLEGEMMYDLRYEQI